jgi:toxin HigB-1
MIKSFYCKDTARLFRRERVLRFLSFELIARDKLELVNAAVELSDLKIPPGNKLEKLKGDRKN